MQLHKDHKCQYCALYLHHLLLNCELLLSNDSTDIKLLKMYVHILESIKIIQRFSEAKETLEI